MSAERVLVVGGTGHLGKQGVSQPRERGHAIRALVRLSAAGLAEDAPRAVTQAPRVQGADARSAN